MSENYINPFKQFATNNQKENEERKENKSNKTATEIKLDELIAFENQPFDEYTSNEMENLKESIERIGLQEPIIVRKKDDKYEILSGHNRVACYRELGRETIEAFIVEADDDTARLIMIDSNIVQRESLSVMERARAYKIKDEIKRRRKFDTNIVNANLSEEEKEKIKEDEQNRTYYRLLSLNNLIPEYQAMCDNESLSIKSGEQLSKLNKEQQKQIYETLGTAKITEKKAENLRNLATSNKELTKELIKEEFSGNKNIIKSSVKFTKKEMEKYFLDCITNEEIKERIIESLENFLT